MFYVGRALLPATAASAAGSCLRPTDQEGAQECPERDRKARCDSSPGGATRQ